MPLQTTQWLFLITFCLFQLYHFLLVPAHCQSINNGNGSIDVLIANLGKPAERNQSACGWLCPSWTQQETTTTTFTHIFNFISLSWLFWNFVCIQINVLEVDTKNDYNKRNRKNWKRKKRWNFYKYFRISRFLHQPLHERRYIDILLFVWLGNTISGITSFSQATCLEPLLLTSSINVGKRTPLLSTIDIRGLRNGEGDS